MTTTELQLAELYSHFGLGPEGDAPKSKDAADQVGMRGREKMTELIETISPELIKAAHELATNVHLAALSMAVSPCCITADFFALGIAIGRMECK